jgi:DNA invertase Pin-like site-specific DNA recombinase
MTRTIFYARVSTAEQNSSHQVAQAEAAGFTFDKVVVDHGVSGVAVPLAERPEGKRLFDMLHRGDTLVVRWVDRLGRNYQDVTDTIRHFMREGVIIKTIINGLTFDGATTDPMQAAVRDALIGFMAATAQSQAEATKEAQKAGIAAVKAREEEKAEKYRGRKPSFNRDQLMIVKEMVATGAGTSAIATAAGLTRQTVLRIKENFAAAEEAIARWTRTEEREAS